MNSVRRSGKGSLRRSIRFDSGAGGPGKIETQQSGNLVEILLAQAANRAGLQGRGGDARRGLLGHEQDARLRPDTTDRPGGIQAIHPGHADIHERPIRLRGRKLGEALRAVGAFDHSAGPRSDDFAHHSPHGGRIIDDHEGHVACHKRPEFTPGNCIPASVATPNLPSVVARMAAEFILRVGNLPVLRNLPSE